MSEEENAVFDVVIVGAGIAGIAAADHLIRAGITNIKVLEARNRIGGRIHTISMGPGKGKGQEHLVELGAQWIHGEGKGSIYSLAKKHQLVNKETTHDEFGGNYWYHDGTKIDKVLLNKVMSIFKNVVEDMVEDDDDHMEFPDRSCDGYLQERLSKSIVEFRECDRPLAADVFTALKNILTEDCSDDLKSLSLIYCGFDDDFKNRNFNFVKGFESVVDVLAQKVHQNSISLNTEVVTIDWSNTETNNEVILHCSKSGESVEIKAKYVIVTLPLGVLKKRHADMFRPRLPETKVKTIEKLGFGKACKILLYYSNPFWPSNQGGFRLVRSTENNQTSNFSWERNLFAFKETNSNILIAWVCGNGAEEVEVLSEDEIGNVCTRTLRRFLNDPTVPFPCNVICSRWSTDPFTLGGYPFISVGGCPADMDELASPVTSQSGHPTLFFAGDATDTDKYGSTNGALASGRREAKQVEKIINKFNFKQNCEI